MDTSILETFGMRLVRPAYLKRFSSMCGFTDIVTDSFQNNYEEEIYDADPSALQ
jgi:hypothetical protein